MKRPIQPPIADTFAPGRRRGLSEEERALWESVAKQVKPLRKKPQLAKPPMTLPIEEARPAKATAAKAKPANVASHSGPDKSPRPAKLEAPPLAPLGRRERAHLSRGRKQIEARLDLHGMTQTRAHRALTEFLRRAHHEGLSFVLVITGKGKGAAESEPGVLRRLVPQWLGLPEFRAMVVGFDEAHIGHGGAGALYVRIRRSKL